MLPMLYNPKQHHIISGGELIAWCKREAPAKDTKRLFLYRHRVHGTFVIAMWASDRALGVFTDFLNLGYSLNNFDRKKAQEYLRRLYAPTSAPEMARTINQTSRNYDTIRQDEDAEERERIEKRQRDG